MQARLFELGYYNGRIDGRYSSETTAAVKAFQKANGLSADGIAGQDVYKRQQYAFGIGRAARMRRIGVNGCA